MTKEADEAGAVILRVESQGAVETTGAKVCSGACGELRATCTSADTFPPGRHTLNHGADTAELLLGTRSQCLFSE